MKKNITYFVIILITGFACNTSFNIDEPSYLKDASENGILISDKDYKDARVDHFFLDTAYIENSTLKAKVRYGGGCGDVYFHLITDGAFMESAPVQLKAVLACTDKDDCEALITKDLSFDLSDLVDLYNSQYQTNGGIITIDLKSCKKLNFSF